MTKLVPILNGTWDKSAYLFKINFEFFCRKTRYYHKDVTSSWYYWQNLTSYNHFLLYNKQKLLGMHIILKIASAAKKASNESDKYHVPVLRSRTISGLSVVI